MRWEHVEVVWPELIEDADQKLQYIVVSFVLKLMYFLFYTNENIDFRLI